MDVRSPDPMLSAAAVLWRQAAEPELFLARRVEGMRFFGKVWSFCGGRVEPCDKEVAAASADRDRTTLRSCLVRELIEELGYDLRTAAMADRQLRTDLCSGTADWGRACTATELDRLAEPCLRLVTPDFYPRRFDTHFFVCEVPVDTRPELLTTELDQGGWDRAAGWLDRWGQGEFFLAPPALLMLRELATRPVSEWENALRAAQARVENPGLRHEIRLEPAVRLIAVRTPTLPPARHTNCYLVGQRAGWIVDPATPFADEQEILIATLEDAGAQPAGVLLTHHHHDHIGAVRRVADHFGIGVLAHRETARLVAPQIEVSRLVADGEELGFTHADGQPGRLCAVFTPGHAAGHLCYYEPRYKGLIAGDMVSTLSSILIDPDDGDMASYMDSLERLARLDIETVYPAHGPADARGVRVIEDQIRHRGVRRQAVLAALTDAPTPLSVLTRKVWGDVPRPMLGYAQKSAISILRMLQNEGLATFDGEAAARC